ncbi:MAG TPA: hypothetical protein VK752_09350 [Bryobacteraceae bacterium]|jgi:hypothetical protein|nr:hypothetical protein [Bryobacteraceae bacterium]
MNELLKALADHDRQREAPETVELRLRSAFRRKYAHPKWPYFAVAASVVIALLVYSPQKPQTMEIAVVTPPVPVLAVNKTAPRKTVLHSSRPTEVVTEFYSLMEDAPPFEQGELLRVSLPAAAMRGVGLPVDEDRLADMVQADVLVGQEGLARAIRFVNTNVNRP